MEHMSEPSTLFAAPGFDLKYVAIDSMHAGDLGIFQDAIGSLMWIEVYNKQYHGSKNKGVVGLRALLANYYSANRERGYSQFMPTIQQIVSKTLKYPCLKAKAAETRHLANFCVLLANAHRHGGFGRPTFRFRATHFLSGREDAHSGHLCNVFQGLADYHAACAAEPFVKDDCTRSMYRFLQSFKELHDMWRDGRSLMEQTVAPFHMRPKAHMLHHLVEDQLKLWGSPIRSWCYRDEDFVGSVKKIASKSKNPHTLESRLNEKLQLLGGLHMYV